MNNFDFGGPPTMRCGICNKNWPYHAMFAQCFLCGEKTRALKLKEETDQVMTWETAIGTARGKAAIEEHENPKPKGRTPTQSEMAKFRAGLDYWAHAEGPDDPRLG